MTYKVSPRSTFYANWNSMPKMRRKQQARNINDKTGSIVQLQTGYGDTVLFSEKPGAFSTYANQSLSKFKKKNYLSWYPWTIRTLNIKHSLAF